MPHMGEKATMVQEPDNEYDRYAVAVLKQVTYCVVGHIPRKVSKECYFFLQRGRLIEVEVTGRRQRSTKPDGEMEIPRTLTFYHAKEKTLSKAKDLIERKGFKEGRDHHQDYQGKQLKKSTRTQKTN